MMKCIFVVVLLQVCYCFPTNTTPTSYTPDFNLNNEIIKELEKLKKNVTHNIPKFISVPGEYMSNNTAKCVAAFSKGLKHVLGNLTQRGIVQANIEGLNSKLDLLEKQGQKNDKCTMTRRKKNPFKIYMDFIKQLNTSR